jgi:hypothetical protein
MKNNPRTISDFLTTMPSNESLETARLRVVVAWEAIRDLEPTVSHFHNVEVENYFRAAQQHRDLLETQSILKS